MSESQRWEGAMAIIANALERLDTRRHVIPAQLELAKREGEWVAMVIADPLAHSVLVGRGPRPRDAICELADACARMDWRRVRR